MNNQHPPHEMWLHIIIATTIAINVILGVMAMGYMAIMAIAIPDQFDRIITLMVGALIGFLTKAGVSHVVQPPPGPDE